MAATDLPSQITASESSASFSSSSSSSSSSMKLPTSTSGFVDVGHGCSSKSNTNATALAWKKHSTLSTAASVSTTSTSNSGSVNDGDFSHDHDFIKHNDVQVYFEKDVVIKFNEHAKNENAKLNLNLGLPIDFTVFTSRHPIDSKNHGSWIMSLLKKIIRLPIRTMLHLFDRFLSWVEHPLFNFWSQFIPLRLRQKITFLGWSLYLPIHKFLIGKKTGLHRDVSFEYHALTSVMWWGRLFPITIRRIRYSLSQLHVCHPPYAYPSWNKTASSNPNHSDMKLNNGSKNDIRGHLYEVYHEMKQKKTPTGTKRIDNPAAPEMNFSKAEMTVTGLYIQHFSQQSQKVIFWIYGGAFLAGDSRGNLGIAEKMGMLCGADGDNEMRDIFIPDYRLVPENHLDDAIHDITLAYEYLIYERGIDPDNVTLLGISSGGGLVVLLLQALAEARRKYETMQSNDGVVSDCTPMPAGGVLMCPFVDYTEPKGSMQEYIKHDLIVNQAVYEEGIPYLEKVLGCHENRVRASPCYGKFAGLPPLCICVSEHEVVYDQTMILAKRAEEQGVDVTVGVWKYMCHVFPMLCPFIPEGRESFNFMCDWIKAH